MFWGGEVFLFVCLILKSQHSPPKSSSLFPSQQSCCNPDIKLILLSAMETLVWPTSAAFQRHLRNRSSVSSAWGRPPGPQSGKWTEHRKSKCSSRAQAASPRTSEASDMSSTMLTWENCWHKLTSTHFSLLNQNHRFKCQNETWKHQGGDYEVTNAQCPNDIVSKFSIQVFTFFPISFTNGGLEDTPTLFGSHTYPKERYLTATSQRKRERSLELSTEAKVYQLPFTIRVSQRSTWSTSNARKLNIIPIRHVPS